MSESVRKKVVGVKGIHRDSYLCLDHLDTFGSHASQEFINIDCFVMLHSLQHAVQDNEGTSPANASTAVDQHGRT